MSTKCTRTYLTGEGWSLHIYTECFDEQENVYLESWIQGDSDNYCESIMLPPGVWEKVLDEEVATQAKENAALKERVGQLEEVIGGTRISLSEARDIAFGLMHQIEAARIQTSEEEAGKEVGDE